MTRQLQAIEAELDAARASHQAAEANRQKAVQLVADLRARVIGGDETVTAAELATAEHEAEHRALPIDAKLRAIQVLEKEALTARTEAWADEVAATEPDLRGDVEHAFAALEAVLDHLVAAWRLHAGYVHETAVAVGTTVGTDVTPRVHRNFGGGRVFVQGAEIRVIPVHDRLAQIVRKAHDQLSAGHPKAQR